MENHKVMKAPCLYCLFEGDKYEFSANMRNMEMGVDICRENLWIFYHFGLCLNTHNGINQLIGIIDNGISTKGMAIPKVIVVDCLYMAFQGKLSDDEEGSNFCRNMRQLNDRYNCAIILIHHTHRAKRTDKGNVVDEGDEGFFGSFLWKAFPNHILLFSNIPGRGKVLTCNTQRSGKIIEKIEMNFLQPTPLMFEVKGDLTPIMKIVMKEITRQGVSIQDLATKLDMSMGMVRSCVSWLRFEDKVERVEGQYPYLWRVK